MVVFANRFERQLLRARTKSRETRRASETYSYSRGKDPGRDALEHFTLDGACDTREELTRDAAELVGHREQDFACYSRHERESGPTFENRRCIFMHSIFRCIQQWKEAAFINFPEAERIAARLALARLGRTDLISIVLWRQVRAVLCFAVQCGAILCFTLRPENPGCTGQPAQPSRIKVDSNGETL